ncbi:MAG: hypothetical protein IV086_16510 [Hyphomonadaceae bacterium]|nr:hypothetical protein [Hyphomonadaceae bacterium]
MRLGWFGSFGVHVLIAAATMIAWPRGEEDLPPAGAVVPIDIIDTISSVTNVSAIAPQLSEDQADENVTPEGAPQTTAPPVPEAPEPIPDPRQKMKSKEKERQPTSLEDFQGAIDRWKEKGADDPGNPDAPTGPRPRERIGAGNELTSSEPDAIASAIDRRWQNFSDFPNPERYWVTIRIQINANGTLARAPQVLRTSLPLSDPYMKVGVERSLRAILSAEPLPVDPARTSRATFTMNFYLRD